MSERPSFTVEYIDPVEIEAEPLPDEFSASRLKRSLAIVVGIVAGLVDSTFLWDMVSMGTLTAFIIVSIAVPVLRSKDRKAGIAAVKKGGFRVPFGAYFVPALSIAACSYLMINLSHATKVIFTVWMIVAVITYFFYGIHNSRLKKV